MEEVGTSTERKEKLRVASLALHWCADGEAASTRARHRGLAAEVEVARGAAG
jgi:hypothetical protein